MSKQTGTGLFGWCLTAQHAMCWRQINIEPAGKVLLCACPCHTKEEKE